MMLITMSLASVFAFAGRKSPAFSHWLGLASGLASLLFGLMMGYQVLLADGLRATSLQ